MPADHNFVVVAERTVDADPMWGAETEVLDPGGQQTITFTPDAAGSFFYICTVDTHMTNEMWGELIVED
jgi:plastocyanin